MNIVQEKKSFFELVPEKFKTRELCLEAVKRNVSNIIYLLDEFKTKENLIEICKRDPFAIKFLPEEFITQELCNEIVRKDKYRIYNIPKKFITKELCEIHMPLQALDLIPEEFKDYEVCLEAVRIESKNIQFVPDDMIDEVMISLIFGNEYIDSDIIKYIPKRFITKELMLSLISFNYSILENIPKEYIDNPAEFYKESIYANTVCIEITPKEYITKEISEYILKYKPIDISYIPKEHITQEAILKIVKDNKTYDAKYIFTELREYINKEICDAAFENMFSSFIHIPNEFKDYNMCLKAVSINACFLHYTPAGILSKEDYLKVFNTNPSVIADIPEEYLTQEMCDKYVIASVLPTLKVIPEKYITQEMCNFIAIKYPCNLGFIPKEYLTEEIITHIVDTCKRSSWIFKENSEFIPKEYLTKDFYMELIKNCPDFIENIPEEFKDYDMYLEAIKNTTKITTSLTDFEFLN